MFIKILKVIGWIIVGILVFIAFLLLYIHISWSGIFVPNPRMPEITNAEFPFRIEIEYDRERIVFEDSIVCEYTGVGVSDYGTKKHRRWKERFASGREYSKNYPSIVLLDTTDVLVRFIFGEGAYYMDIPYYDMPKYYEVEKFDKHNDGTPYSPWRPKIYIYNKNMKGQEELSFTYIDITPQQDEQLRGTLAKYGVEIISIEQTPPIVNTFR